MSANYLLNQAAAIADPDTFGETFAGGVLGLTVCDGLAMPWEDGGVLLARRPLHPAEGPLLPCGFQPADNDLEVRSALAHGADQSYRYTAFGVCGNGYVSEDHPPPVRVDFDSGGNLIATGLPDRPRNIAGRPVAGGAFEVTFACGRPFDGAPFPDGYRVYGGDPVNYAAPLTHAPSGQTYLPFVGTGVYVFLTTAYAGGTTLRFGARAYTDAGGEESNEYQTDWVTAIASGPAQIEVGIDSSQLSLPARGGRM